MKLTLLDIRFISMFILVNDRANRPICEKAGTKWHENVLAFEYPGVGMTCLYFIVECFVYLTLVILIEVCVFSH